MHIQHARDAGTRVCMSLDKLLVTTRLRTSTVGSICCSSLPSVLNLSLESKAITPAGNTKAIFNDTYILFDGSLAIPTHILSYHLEVDEVCIHHIGVLVCINHPCCR